MFDVYESDLRFDHVYFFVEQVDFTGLKKIELKLFWRCATDCDVKETSIRRMREHHDNKSFKIIITQ